MLEDLTPPPHRLLTCKVATVLADLEVKDQKILLEALDDTDKWGHSPLSRALRSKGIQIADTTIARHRAGECRCEN
jgi:hypothetical protein